MKKSFITSGPGLGSFLNPNLKINVLCLSIFLLHLGKVWSRSSLKRLKLAGLISCPVLLNNLTCIIDPDKQTFTLKFRLFSYP